MDTTVASTYIVRLAEDAREIRRGVENVLGDEYCIDVREFDIPIRLLGRSAIEQAALEHKTSLNAHTMAQSVKTVLVRHEVKLPFMMARHMHTRQYYASENIQVSSLPASVSRAKKSVYRDVDEILVLQGLTRQVAAAEIAKELGRAFLFLKEYPPLDVVTEAGFAELCSYLWVKWQKESAEREADNAQNMLHVCMEDESYARAELENVMSQIEDARRCVCVCGWVGGCMCIHERVFMSVYKCVFVFT
jgi:hypothetical protein